MATKQEKLNEITMTGWRRSLTTSREWRRRRPMETKTIKCDKPDHADMPSHYHMLGEVESRLQRLEEFKSRVEKAMADNHLPEDFKRKVSEAAESADVY